MSDIPTLTSVYRYWQDLGYRWMCLAQAAGARTRGLQELHRMVQRCQRCPLHRERKQAVLGVGNPWSPLMLIGEGPGAQEDTEGQPFVGAAGQLLTKTLAMVGIRREDVYIANVVKCRPPGNRTPRPSEMQACFPYLITQIEIIRPAILVPMGNPATQMILGQSGIMQLRGRWFRKNGTWICPIFHPAYVLRNPNAFPTFLQDIQAIVAVARRLGWR